MIGAPRDGATLKSSVHAPRLHERAADDGRWGGVGRYFEVDLGADDLATGRAARSADVRLQAGEEDHVALVEDQTVRDDDRAHVGAVDVDRHPVQHERLRSETGTVTRAAGYARLGETPHLHDGLLDCG